MGDVLEADQVFHPESGFEQTQVGTWSAKGSWTFHSGARHLRYQVGRAEALHPLRGTPPILSRCPAVKGPKNAYETARGAT